MPGFIKPQILGNRMRIIVEIVVKKCVNEINWSHHIKTKLTFSPDGTRR